MFEVTEIALPVSLPNTPEAIVNVTPAAVTALSSAAVGAAGLTVNVTVEDVVAPEESLIVYGTVTVPMNPTGGVYTTEPPTTEVEPCPAGGEPTDTTDNPDPTSLTVGSTDAVIHHHRHHIRHRHRRHRQVQHRTGRPAEPVGHGV